MGNALVVQRTRLPQSQTALRAAQYVRMSTNYQRYSIENEAAVIAAYAQLHRLVIVRTYRDTDFRFARDIWAHPTVRRVSVHHVRRGNRRRRPS